MKRLNLLSVLLMVLVVFLATGCVAPEILISERGDPPRQSSTHYDYLSIRNNTNCSLLIDRTWGESMVLKPGHKITLRNFISSRERSRTLQVGITSFSQEIDCDDIRPLNRRWTVSSGMDSSALWIIDLQGGYLSIY